MTPRLFALWPCGPLSPRSICAMSVCVAPIVVAAGLYGAVQGLAWLLEALLAA